MSEGFFQRWSRVKAEPKPAPTELEPPLAPPPATATPAYSSDDGAPPRLPTMGDVAGLGMDSDYSAFVARGVDKSVQRSALKKLFADPHFNIGDGLDLYMGDYNKPDPIPAAMMSALRHTQSFFAQAYPERKTEDDEPTMAQDATLPETDSPMTPTQKEAAMDAAPDDPGKDRA